jgi:glycosyltransferase involved in cell wall biosynthesis
MIPTLTRAGSARMTDDAALPPVLSIIVPAHNEQASLEGVVSAIARVVQGYSHEIIIVDDGSSDDTWRCVITLKTRLPEVSGIRLTRNFGHQAAILAGLSVARGSAAIMLDADGQHSPEDIPRFIEEWERGTLVVQGVRTATEGEALTKRWTSRAFYRLLSAFGGPEIPTGSADYRLLARPVVDVVLQSGGPMIFLRGLIPWLGFPVAYVPFVARRRQGGSPSYTWWRMLRFSVHGLLSFTIVPLRIAMFLGLAVAGFSFAYLGLVVVAWFTSAAVVPGWASVMGLLSLLGGIQLLTIGVLGEYVGRIFNAHLHRPHFVVRDRV